MPRSLPLGNGNMLITLDKRGLLHDFYFPYVGMEDHTTFGHYHKIGLFDEDQQRFTWITDDHWNTSNRYLDESLVGETTLKSDDWQLKLIFTDFVHPIENVFCRKLLVENLSENNRNLKLYFEFDFHIYGVKGNDTVYYSPEDNNLIFYKFNRYFLIEGQTHKGGIKEYATGKSEYRGLEGTWRDAEDGHLSGHPIEQGSVDATIGFEMELAPKTKSELKLWINVGKDLNEVTKLNHKVKSRGIDEMFDYTNNYWRSWVNKQDFSFTGLSDDMIKLFKQSLLIIRSQIDNNGAIIAANDTDIMKFNKDTYSYMWPRDGAFVAHALDNTGYSEITKRFFSFCQKVQTKDGYLMHKYNPDGSLGSSWHPWLYNNEAQIPIQEDETALPIVALRNHYERSHDIEFIQTVFDKFVLKAANFLCEFRDPETGLPLPSYDPWEEQKGIFTYTCTTVYAGLKAAAELSAIVGHDEHAERYSQAAESVKNAILKYLYCSEKNCFVKKIDINGNKDYKPDASVSVVYILGLLQADDPRVINTMKRIKEKLEVKTEIGGLARYEHDKYQAIADYPKEIPGNPWIITTLWYTQWLLMISKDYNDENFKEAEKWITWTTKQADSTGVLPEQINPYNGDHLSVSPLTWSHATFVDTIMLYRQKLSDFGICEDCFIPTFKY